MAYLGKTPSQAVRSRYYYTAAGSETSLSGADDNNNTLIFTDGNYVDVYLNGVLLVSDTDYNTTTANTISGLAALAANDIVEIVVYDTFSVFGGEVKGDFNVTNGTLTADFEGTFTFQAKNTSGAGIAKGTPVYISGHSGNSAEIGVADANDPAKMPSFGIAAEAIGNNLTGKVVSYGNLKEIDTSAFAVGDSLYVSNTGTLTATRPSGTSDEVQKVAKVIRSHASVGQLFVMGAGRTNDIPNFTSNSILFDDNAKAIFGAGSDLQIYHSGIHSYVDDAGTGDLRLRGNAGVYLGKYTGEAMVDAIADGAVTLYYDNSPKLATTSSGIDVTGTITANGGVIKGERGTASAPAYTFNDDTDTGMFNISNADLGFSVGGSERLRIDSSGNVGINTTAPAAPLDIAITSNQGLLIDATAGNNAYLSITNGGSNTGAKIGFDNASNAAVIGHHTHGNILYANSSGNVGIGTAPSTVLHLNDVTDPIIRLQRGGGVYSQIQSDGAGSLYLSADAANTTASSRMQFNVDGSEAARISGGSFLVGTSNEAPASNNVSGVALKNGASHFSADSGEALRINRKTSDGQLISLRKDASEIGSVGSYGGVYANIGTGNVGLMFNTGGQAIIPHNMTTNAPRGSGIDLGQTGYKWKDAYFSGTVYADQFLGQNDTNTGIAVGGNDVIQFSTGGGEKARFTSTGQLLVGQTTNNAHLNTATGDGLTITQSGEINQGTTGESMILNRRGSDGTITRFRRQGNTVGTISVTTSGTTYNTTSDLRLKTDIAPIADATDKLMAMNAVTHKWKADPDADAVVGFIAQEMAEIVPEAVSGDPDGEGMMSMDYGRITPVIVAALQNALKEIDMLKDRIAELEAK